MPISNRRPEQKPLPMLVGPNKGMTRCCRSIIIIPQLRPTHPLTLLRASIRHVKHLYLPLPLSPTPDFRSVMLCVNTHEHVLLLTLNACSLYLDLITLNIGLHTCTHNFPLIIMYRLPLASSSSTLHCVIDIICSFVPIVWFYY